MLINYFKIAWRNVAKNKIFTAINVLGLALGISACIVIYLVTSFELSYDHFHPDKKRIYRVVSTIHQNSGENLYLSNVPEPMAAAIRSDFTGIENVVQFHNYAAKITLKDDTAESKKFYAANEGEESSDIIITDPEYFNIFQYQWLEGNMASLKEPFHVVLTESKARKYFGLLSFDQMIGKEITYDDSLRVFVSGIVKDYPENSDFNFKDFISAATIPNSFLKHHYNFSNWSNWKSNSQTFLKLKQHIAQQQFEKQAVQIIEKNMDLGKDEKADFVLQPLSDIHFNTLYQDRYSRTVHLPALYGLMGISLFILLIAAINFINLSTAQSLQRAKEIGIRKVLGSNRTRLVWQFLGEAFMLTLFAVILALVATPTLLFVFRAFVPDGVALHLNFQTLFFTILVTVLTALLAGLYPAKILSSYLPITALKRDTVQKGSSKNYFRKGLIVFQFAISLVFIIGALVIGHQIHYMLNKDMGFARNAIINISTHGNYPGDKTKLLADKIGKLPGVDITSVGMGTPIAKDHSGTKIKCTTLGDKEVESHIQTGDERYISLYQLKLVAGRNLLSSDTIREYLINETCAKKLGFQTPQDAIGKYLEQNGINDGTVGHKKLPIVGVLADFHLESMHKPIAATFITTSKEYSRVISVKLSTELQQIGDFKQTLAHIENHWKEIYPNEKFEYQFFDEAIARLYDKEQKTEQLMNAAMAIAIFISCMGLFGLAAFTAQQRTKEIGVRKVLGASVAGIISMLAKDFLKLVLLAIVIASPVAYYFMYRWLQDFSYRININGWAFILAGLSAILIAFITISFHAVKAALANPVKSLRSE